MSLKKVRRRLATAREKLAERNGLQRWFARKLLPFTQTFGFSVVGDHFYEPVPNLGDIEKNYSSALRPLPGFLPLPHWEQAMEEIVGGYLQEYQDSVAYTKHGIKNWFYTGWDAAYYYCLIRSKRPRLITEVGRGVSTSIASLALERNAAEGHPGEMVSIDPYFRGAASGSARIITAELQQIAPEERKTLAAADILFLDSSHIAKWGSDVMHLFESWIPDVAVNTLVHIHDIFTPYDYPKDWYLREKRFWNEQSILESFLAFNNSFQIECPIFYLGKEGALARLAAKYSFPALSAKSGSAFWLRRVQ